MIKTTSSVCTFFDDVGHVDKEKLGVSLTKGSPHCMANLDQNKAFLGLRR